MGADTIKAQWFWSVHHPVGLLFFCLVALSLLTMLPSQGLAGTQGIEAAPTCPPFPSRKDGLVTGALVEMEPPCQPAAFAFYSSDGRSHTLQSFRGQPVLLNLWATWCTPCVREMPSLLELDRTGGQSGIRVIALNQDINGERAAAPFLEKNGWSNLGLWLDRKNNAARVLGVPGLPVSFLFNRDGLMVARLAGETDWSSAVMAGILHRLVGNPVTGQAPTEAVEVVPTPSPEDG